MKYYRITISDTNGKSPDMVEYFHGRRVKSSKPYKELYHKFAFSRSYDYTNLKTEVISRAEFLKENNLGKSLKPQQISMIEAVLPYYDSNVSSDLEIKTQLQTILKDNIYTEKQTKMLNGIRFAYNKGMFNKMKNTH